MRVSCHKRGGYSRRDRLRIKVALAGNQQNVHEILDPARCARWMWLSQGVHLFRKVLAERVTTKHDWLKSGKGQQRRCRNHIGRLEHRISPADVEVKHLKGTAIELSLNLKADAVGIVSHRPMGLAYEILEPVAQLE